MKGLQLLTINLWLNSGSVKQDRPTDEGHTGVSEDSNVKINKSIYLS